jgi:hypothetical protein
MNAMIRSLLLAAALLPTPALAQALPDPQRAAILKDVDARAPTLASTAKAIWDLSEVGYQEAKSSALLQAELRKAGFTVTAGVAGMPRSSPATRRVQALSSRSWPNMTRCRASASRSPPPNSRSPARPPATPAATTCSAPPASPRRWRSSSG